MKNELMEYLNNQLDLIETGNADPIKAYIELYEMEKMIKETLSEVKNHAIDKRENYPGKDYIVGDYNVKVQSTKRWSFDDAELDRLKTLQKQREAMMKSAFMASEKGVVFHDENGEVVNPAEVKWSTFIKLEKA